MLHPRYRRTLRGEVPIPDLDVQVPQALHPTFKFKRFEQKHGRRGHPVFPTTRSIGLYASWSAGKGAIVRRSRRGQGCGQSASRARAPKGLSSRCKAINPSQCLPKRHLVRTQTAVVRCTCAPPAGGISQRVVPRMPSIDTKPKLPPAARQASPRLNRTPSIASPPKACQKHKARSAGDYR